MMFNSKALIVLCLLARPVSTIYDLKDKVVNVEISNPNCADDSTPCIGSPATQAILLKRWKTITGKDYELRPPVYFEWKAC
jgi:hypothetical protein